jgi:hypothetical protein
MIHYVPDRTFVNDIKKLDPKLGCKYVPSHKRFVVTYGRAVGGSVPVFMVKGENGEFRQPDKRDLDFLLSGDLTREDMKTKLQKSALYMEKVGEKKLKDAQDNIRNATKDDKIQLTNAFSKLGGGGKGNSAFRRIEPKTKGTTGLTK